MMTVNHDLQPREFRNALVQVSLYYIFLDYISSLFLWNVGDAIQVEIE